MTIASSLTDIGLFGEARHNVTNFCHNLILSHAMHKCVTEMERMQQEYDEAICAGNEELAKEKQAQIQIYFSSLQLTAHMFESVDAIGT
mgnify:FL=1